MIEQSDIRDILGEMAAERMGGSSKLERLLKHFSAKGIPLETCADHRHLGRAVSTLKRYARLLDLTFPDYVPRHLQPKKAKA
jgi:hypothetical protein